MSLGFACEITTSCFLLHIQCQQATWLTHLAMPITYNPVCSAVLQMGWEF